MTNDCMVTGCKDKAQKYVFDGVFWIKTCQKHYLEFQRFAKDNNLTFQEKELMIK